MDDDLIYEVTISFPDDYRFLSSIISHLAIFFLDLFPLNLYNFFYSSIGIIPEVQSPSPPGA